jgi:hypothetical protein
VREKQKIAGIWMNADSHRFRSAPSFYAVASSRPITELVDERTAAIYELGLQNLQLSPGGGAQPDKERRFEAGLLDLRRRQGLYAEIPMAWRSATASSTAPASHPQPGAGRHLHRRNLPDRPRQGDRRRDQGDRGRKTGFERFVATRRRATNSSTALPPCCCRSASAGPPPPCSAAAASQILTAPLAAFTTI